MADQDHPDIPEVFDIKARQNISIDRVVAKRRRILLETQPAQPVGNIKFHRQHFLEVNACALRSFDASIT